MEVIFAIPILFIPMVIPLITGVMANGFGRKFWPWFIIGLLLPFISCIVLLCLPDKSGKKKRVWKVDEEQEMANHYFIHGDKTINSHESDLPATA